MPIRTNSIYADPNIAKSFDNLADVFKTPSGSDAYGYAHAAATRQKAANLQYLFDNTTAPDFDRKNIAAGNYTPVQSLFAQNQNDSTARRNADVSASAQANVANINNAGALERRTLDAVTLKDGETGFLGPVAAKKLGLPEMFRGNITANPGQTVTTPTGEVIAGAPKPMSETELKAAILAKQPEAAQTAAVMSSAPVESVVTPAGPRVAYRSDAVGQEPYSKDTSKPQIANYKTPDGKVGTASLNDQGIWIDTQSKGPLPQGTQTYTANLQGDKDATGLGAGTKNNIDGMLVDLTLAQDTSKTLRKIITNNPGVQGLVGHIRGTVQDVIATGGEIGQLLDANMKDMERRVSSGLVDPTIAKKFANFDKSIPAATMLQTLLTAQVAKVLDPNGRVSNDRYEQVAKALGNGGWTGNQQKTLATLDALDGIINSRRSLLAPTAPAAAKIGQTPSTAPAVTPATSGKPESWQIDMLRSDPSKAAFFDQKFGAGAAARVLGGQ